MKSVARTITYRQAQADLNCKSGGKQLCSLTEELCENGHTPIIGVISGDHWVPVRNGFNSSERRVILVAAQKELSHQMDANR